MAHEPAPVDSVKLAAFFEMVRINDSLSSNSEPTELRFFDPNKDSYDSLIAKGIPAAIASNMISYREKVKPFKSKTELLKLYKMTKSDYDRLKDFAILPKGPEYVAQSIQNELLIEINKANQLEFSKLRGIGPVLSTRIIKYRELLGGYIKIEQLLEVYGISDSLFSTFRNQLSCTYLDTKKIDINSADYLSLIRHPYFDKPKVKTVLRYRKHIKEIKDLNELYQLEGFDSNYVQRILPYLQLSE